MDSRPADSASRLRAGLGIGVRPRPGRGELDPELLWGLLGALSLALVHFSPSLPLPGIPCFFKSLIGIPCPTCGMTRCVQALGLFEWPLAFRMHPALAAGYFGLWLYVPYAAGALAGLWPRMRLEPSAPAAMAIRISALFAFAGLWGFLITDGR